MNNSAIKNISITKEGASFSELVSWLEQNVGETVWMHQDIFAQGDDWIVSASKTRWRIVVIDNSDKVRQWYMELLFKWG